MKTNEKKSNMRIISKSLHTEHSGDEQIDYFFYVPINFLEAKQISYFAMIHCILFK
jgi:hypothetical protein